MISEKEKMSNSDNCRQISNLRIKGAILKKEIS
jgi:hypothetical protein